MISIVLPCLNELRHGYLPSILDNLAHQSGEKEIIAVVSPSQDDTLAVLQRAPQVHVLEVGGRNRAQRLNRGIEASQGEVVLLHHPATLLPPRTALQDIERAIADPAVVWGGFRHRFDWEHPLLQFTSWYSNRVRPRWSGILYLDHCVFARRDVLMALGGVPDMDIFEDTVLSQRLRRYGPPHLLSDSVTTSARRFRRRGVYQQALLNQMLKLMYHLKLDPGWMNRLYERRLQINVAYSQPTAPTAQPGQARPDKSSEAEESQR